MSADATGAPAAPAQAAVTAAAPAATAGVTYVPQNIVPTPAQPASPAVPNIVVNVPPTPAAPATPAPAADQTVAIPLSQLQAFTSIQARLADMEAAQRAQQEAAQQAQAKLLMEKGDLENGMRLLREQHEQMLRAAKDQHAELQSQAQSYAMDVEVNRAIVGQLASLGHKFCNDEAARDFEAKVRGQLLAQPEGKSFVVRTPTFQTAEQVVNGMLNSGRFDYMLAGKVAAPTQAAPQTTQAAPTQVANPAAPPSDKPQNLGHAFLMQYKHDLANAGPVADPRVNVSKGFGLGAIG